MAKEIGNWGKVARSSTLGTARTAADLIRDRLQPGEKLIWSARALGRSDPLQDFGAADWLFTGFSVLGAVAALSSEWMSIFRLVLLGVSIALALVVAIRAGFMFLPKVYALTNRRVVVFHRFIKFEDSIAGDEIEKISVNERRSGLGDIVLRSSRPGEIRLALVTRGAELIGVENPRHAAELIRATLAPALEVTTA